MTVLLDTNVVSELMRKTPAPTPHDIAQDPAHLLFHGAPITRCPHTQPRLDVVVEVTNRDARHRVMALRQRDSLAYMANALQSPRRECMRPLRGGNEGRGNCGPI